MSEKVISQPSLRNQEPIYAALSPRLKQGGKLLEIGSGTGQHGVYITNRLPHIHWQLSEHASNISLSTPWVKDATNRNLLRCIELDISEKHWPITANEYVYAYCANLLHFVSEEDVSNIFAGMAKALTTGGLFFCYGPINENGFTSDGNASLDTWLKHDINPKAGIKELAFLQKQANHHGLTFKERLNLPANNVILVFEK